MADLAISLLQGVVLLILLRPAVEARGEDGAVPTSADLKMARWGPERWSSREASGVRRLGGAAFFVSVATSSIKLAMARCVIIAGADPDKFFSGGTLDEWGQL